MSPDAPMADAGRRHRFRGHICGFGTTIGSRVVIGHWPSSPFGPFTDVMLEDRDGLRSLRAPTREIAEFVSDTYSFDHVHIGAVDATLTSTTFQLSAGDLQVCVSIGRRSPLGWLLHLMPTAVAESTTWCALVDPFAAVVVRGVRTRGTSRHGRREWYGATDQHRVVAISGTLGGHDLGDLADLWPPVSFGFSSAPRRPSLVAVATTVET